MKLIRSNHFQMILAFMLGVTVFFSACKKDDDNDDDPPAGDTGSGGSSGGDDGDVTPAGTLTLNLHADCGDAPCM